MSYTTRLVNQFDENDAQSLTNGDLYIQNLLELETYRSLKSQESFDLKLNPLSPNNGDDTLLEHPISLFSEVFIAQSLQGLQGEIFGGILPTNHQQSVSDDFALANDIMVEQNAMMLEPTEPYEFLLGPDDLRWNANKAVGTAVQVTYDITNGFNNRQKDNIRAALRSLSQNTLLQFIEVDVGNSARLSFGFQSNQGFAHVEYNPRGESEKRITFDPHSNYLNKLTSAVSGTYGFQQLLGAIAKASGLYPPLGGYSREQASTQYTILGGKYHPGMDNPKGEDTQGTFAQTPMMHDLAALQYLYGYAPLAGVGDTTYNWDANQPFVENIFDTSGNDTIDASNFTFGSTINLNPGSFSSIGPASAGSINRAENNLSIAYNPNPVLDTIIENAITGVGDDGVIGNAANNHIQTGQGHDIALGGEGNDTLEGGEGDDELFGGINADTLKGGDGEDTLWGENGGDWLEGGDNNDSLLGGNGEDKIYGEDGNDRLEGGNDSDQLSGGEGDDTLHGGQGDDRMRGQGGNDTLFEQANVNFSLTNTHLDATGGYGTDEIEGFELVHLVGGRSANEFYAYQFNNSVLFVGEDGNDILFGGRRNDTLGGGNHNDILNGFLGDDYLSGGQGDDHIDGGDGWDDLLGGDNDDTLNGNAGNDKLYGNDGDDELNGNEDNDTLTGGQGDDELNGGTGVDWIFEAADSDFHLNNVNLFQMGPGGGIDIHSGIEYVQIKGGGSDNILDANGTDKV